jgi:tRNA nucleotidyltransferase/poly(A) polymerase
MHNITLKTQELQDNPLMQTLYAFAQAKGFQLYLVGGSVRDLLLNRPITDFDFTLESDTLEFAKMFADSIHAPFIPLEEKPPTARVIVKTPQSTQTELSIDFTQFRAASLTGDLRLRDLTINAMAMSLESVMESNSPEIIDPCNGKHDLTKRQLHFPSEQVILDDPLRLMRIYRFAAQLDFEIPQKSTGLVQKHKHLLPQVSKERLRDEFLKTLNVDIATPYLQQIFEMDLLAQVFPNIKQKPTLWYSLENFEGNPIPETLFSYKDEINTYLSEELGLYADRRSLIKLCLLLRGNIGEIDQLLRLSKKAWQFMKCIVMGYQQLSDKELTKKQIVDFLRVSMSDWWGVLLFSAVMHPIPPEVLRKIVDTYYEHFLPILKEGRLITGKDLIQKFEIKEGEKIGMLLKQIEEQQFYGEIRTRAEALAVVETLIRKEDKFYKST